MLPILVNGHPIGYFAYMYGVRQVDPLSPLSFSLPKDILSRGITSLIDSGTLKPMVGPLKFSTLSHVLYEDVIMMFFKGTKCNL